MKSLSLISALFITCFFLMVFHLTLGPTQIDLLTTLESISLNKDTASTIILTEIRLPRMLLAFIVGISLGLSGAALQGLLKNPLAGSDLIGVSSCAALGAVITLYFGFASICIFLCNRHYQ